mgnify:CR=1 FL=1
MMAPYLTALAIILSVFAVGFLLEWLCREDQRGHKWVYRNPATRTCTTCDRQEDNYCSSHAYARFGMRASWKMQPTLAAIGSPSTRLSYAVHRIACSPPTAPRRKAVTNDRPVGLPVHDHSAR